MSAQLVVATHNVGKLREIKQLLQSLPIEVISAAELDIPEPEETGATFAENAQLKATHALQYAPNSYILADDSGLSVDILEGAPGIYSARWGGEDKDFALAMQRVHAEIIQRGATPNGQKAQFNCTLALATPNQSVQCFEGVVEGSLIFPARGDAGFGYDPIFIPDGYTQTFAQIDAKIKQQISHRSVAFAKFFTYFQKLLP